jgi:hypothetical protein
LGIDPQVLLGFSIPLRVVNSLKRWGQFASKVFEIEPVGCEVQNEINTDGTENDNGNMAMKFIGSP